MAPGPLAQTLVASDIVDLSHSVCHWCCHSIPGKVVGIPFRFTDNPRRFYCVARVFCTFACARAYLHKEIRGSLQVRGQSLLPVLYKHMGGRLKEYPRPAPPRNALKLFGGTLTIDEFRRVSKDKLKVTVSPSPIEYACEYVNVAGPPNTKHRLSTRIQVTGPVPSQPRVIPGIATSIPNKETSGIMSFLTSRDQVASTRKARGDSKVECAVKSGPDSLEVSADLPKTHGL